MGSFVSMEQDNFRPNNGDVNWTGRLNALLERTGVEITPVGYQEEGHEAMQLNQTNTIIFINQVADELDCIAVNYEPDGDTWTWYFRHQFSEPSFTDVCQVIGVWAAQIMTLYPQDHVARTYENFMQQDLENIDGFDFGV